jgi:hypothetical protein
MQYIETFDYASRDNLRVYFDGFAGPDTAKINRSYLVEQITTLESCLQSFLAVREPAAQVLMITLQRVCS